MSTETIIKVELATSEALYKGAMAIRKQVFVKEQRIPESKEFDGNDFCAAHVVACLLYTSISGIYAVSEQFKTVKIQPQLFTNAFNGLRFASPGIRGQTVNVKHCQRSLFLRFMVFIAG